MSEALNLEAALPLSKISANSRAAAGMPVDRVPFVFYARQGRRSILLAGSRHLRFRTIDDTLRN